MLKKIIQFSIQNKLVIGLFTLALIAWGMYSLRQLPIDAVPDITNNQVQVITLSPSLATQEVERLISYTGSDLALETADIALMGDKLESLSFAIGLSRKAIGIIKQNLWISLGVVAALIPLTILGITSIGLAVLAHEGSTLVVVANALRLLPYKNDQKEFTK